MSKCWLANPEERPSFHELLTIFTVHLERATEGYGYLTLLKNNCSQQYERLNKMTLAKSFRQDVTDKSH